jgi:hypothetical protein
VTVVTGAEPLRDVDSFDTAEKVLAAARAEGDHWETAAVRYLGQGAVLLASPGWVDDLVNPDAKMVCAAAILTDGAWTWASSLAYYVRTYHVTLPEAFVAHMASRDWVPPQFDDEELEAIGRQFEAQYDS